MYWADKTESEENEEISESTSKLIIQMIISGAGAALLYFFTKGQSGAISAVASGIMAMLAVFFGYSAARLSKKRKKK